MIITSAFTEKLVRLREGKLNMERLTGHIVICGLSRSTEFLVRELEALAERHNRVADIVVISSFGGPQAAAPGRAVLLRGDVTRERVLRDAGVEKASSVIVMAEHPRNESTSVTNMAELLAAELIQQHFPQRFDYDPPAILLEHYPRELHTSGRTPMQPTWDRLSFHSWAPRRVWLGGQERLAFGEPHWTRVAEDDVAALIGRDEMQRLPPHDAAPRHPAAPSSWDLPTKRRAAPRRARAACPPDRTPATLRPHHRGPPRADCPRPWPTRAGHTPSPPAPQCRTSLLVSS